MHQGLNKTIALKNPEVSNPRQYSFAQRSCAAAAKLKG
jgi:hypothetical protein